MDLSTEPLEPLEFRPILRRAVWGGRRLGDVLGKDLGPHDDYAESWEIVDLGEQQSIVAHGRHAGVSLGALVRERGRQLLGQHDPQPGFPLLLKFLDARETLSVQVHPDDARAAQGYPPGRGKTEAWVVLDAAPGSLIYAGLKRGFDQPALAREISRGTSHLCLHSFQPQPGDSVFLPAGTVHALGAGLLVAEIQQASDITYRLFDWNRFGPDGQPRTLHIDQALQAIDYQSGPVHPRKPVAGNPPAIERLVESAYFVLDRRHVTLPQSLGGDDRCHIVAAIEGCLEWQSIGGRPQRFVRGQTLLLPACCPALQWMPSPGGVLLDIYLP